MKARWESFGWDVHEVENGHDFSCIADAVEKAKTVTAVVIYMGVFVAAVAFLVTDTFNPFLYFRF